VNAAEAAARAAELQKQRQELEHKLQEQHEQQQADLDKLRQQLVQERTLREDKERQIEAALAAGPEDQASRELVFQQAMEVQKRKQVTKC
jgi:hypothetical protein